MRMRAFFGVVFVFVFVLMGSFAMAADDAQIKALEEQLRQQQEQNRQIMEMLKGMQGQQGGTASPAAPAQQPPPAAPAQTQAPSSAPVPATVQKPAEKFTPGWLACIMSTAEDDSNNRGRRLLLLGDKQGCFIATKDSYDYKEYTKIPGMPKNPRSAWKGEAFFETRESGRHTFIIDFEAETSGYLEFFFSGGFKIEDAEILNETKKYNYDNRCDDTNKDKVCGTFTGGADLEPGRYKVEFWFYQADPERFRELKKATFSVYTKKPSDALPVPASKSMMVRSAK